MTGDQEPTGWELMRAITRIEGEVKEVRASQAETEKLRRQQNLTITLAIASPIVTFLVLLLSKAGGLQ